LTVRRISHVVVTIFVNFLWRIRPYVDRTSRASPSPLPIDEEPADNGELEALRALIRRFPYWMKGRALLATKSLAANDVATAYAEAQALLALAPKNSHYHATALFELGRCFLRRGDGASALAFLDQAHELTPNKSPVQEERSAALVLLGDKGRALEILETITPTELSAEGKAALQWLSREQSSTPVTN
jgi:tetratricopeptide (TPR) repeat protein